MLKINLQAYNWHKIDHYPEHGNMPNVAILAFNPLEPIADISVI